MECLETKCIELASRIFITGGIIDKTKAENSDIQNTNKDIDELIKTVHLFKFLKTKIPAHFVSSTSVASGNRWCSESGLTGPEICIKKSIFQYFHSFQRKIVHVLCNEDPFRIIELNFS